jgi:hypothetical protein
MDTVTHKDLALAAVKTSYVIAKAEYYAALERKAPDSRIAYLLSVYLEAQRALVDRALSVEG